jgi:TonB family protein
MKALWLSGVLIASLVQGAHSQRPAPAIADTIEKYASSGCYYVDVHEEPVLLSSFDTLIQYPAIAREQRIEGKATANVLIDKTGKVQKVYILQVDNEVFRQAAIDALMKAIYIPAKQEGTPLRLWITQTISFKLH